MNLVYRPVCVRSVGAVAVQVEHHGVGAGQLLHAAAGVGGQHEPRPQPGTRPAPAPGDVEVTRAVLLTLGKEQGMMIDYIMRKGQRDKKLSSLSSK